MRRWNAAGPWSFGVCLSMALAVAGCGKVEPPPQAATPEPPEATQTTDVANSEPDMPKETNSAPAETIAETPASDPTGAPDSQPETPAGTIGAVDTSPETPAASPEKPVKKSTFGALGGVFRRAAAKSMSAPPADEQPGDK